MRTLTRRMVLPCVVALMAIPAAMAAEDPGASLRACRSEVDDAKRLACYDREVDRLAPQAAAPAAPALTPEERFGRTGAMNREESDRREQESRDLAELHATVTEIWTRGDGLMVLTLDNGQIWKQVRPDSLFRIKAGEQVKIQPAALGSFLLSGPNKRSTRVARLK
ncbi:MAG: hypothetical protein AB7T20_05280 [Steroidobacteraceae bacterium]